MKRMYSTPARAAAGFTIVELMIALTVGGIAISSLYAVGAASTRHFREQSRISTTQGSLRAAMNQIKRDFQRAGYLATPNVNLAGEGCAPVGTPLNDPGVALGLGRLAGISAYNKNVAPPVELDPDELNDALVSVDDVTLMGNYSTSGEYMGVVLATTGLSVTIPTSSQSFRRDFTHWYDAGGTSVAGTCDLRAFQNAFAVDRLVRLHTLSDLNAYAQIASVDCDTGSTTATISFRSQIANTCNPTSGWVSPINTIRYRVVPAVGGEMTRGGDNRVAVLRRTEMDPAAKANPLSINDVPVDDRAVLDYVVRFDVDFLVRAAAAPNTVDFVAADVATVQNNPEFVRGAIIEIAARTAEHEPDMDATGVATRLPPFRVFDTQGAARVRSLRAELLLPNIAYEGY